MRAETINSEKLTGGVCVEVEEMGFSWTWKIGHNYISKQTGKW